MKYFINYKETETLDNREENVVEENFRNFSTKERAWEAFEHSIDEHYEGKDFWLGLLWDNECVESIHYDELGNNYCVLMKWNGFDKDIELAWKYKGKKYPTFEDLCEEYPIFKGCGISDRPWIYPDGYKDGDPLAGLYYKAFGKEKDFSFDGEEEEEERPRRHKPVEDDECLSGIDRKELPF